MNGKAESVGGSNVHLFTGYRAEAGRYDEAADANGEVREHWRAFVEELNGTGIADYAGRAAKLSGHVRKSGIAYDAFADTASGPHWDIGLIPLILPPQEWAWLETAVTQRARLFDAVLRDIYGPQTLLHSERIPPQLVFCDPAFLRPLAGHAGDKPQVHFYAADLARGSDGAWRILDNHTETNAGFGYALAGRLAHSKVLGNSFRRCNGVRLAPFLQKLQADILTRAGREDPAIALLTPGPHYDGYFGFAYIARYFGFMLVEGGDLRVVGSSVFLKTLEGLRSIDLIIRCVEGAACDPLELRPEGVLGPAGFTQAVRRNPGLVNNSLGAGLAENRALARYLAPLARELLGEELLLHDAERYWLGDPGARQYVLENLDRMVIRAVREAPARPGQAHPGLHPAELGKQQLAELRERLELEGPALSAEVPQPCSTLPSWTPEGLKPRPFVVRLFAARIGGEFKLMPGGLLLYSEQPDPVALSCSAGHACDVWVTSSGGAPSQLSLIRPALEAAILQRSSKGIPSRIADNLYWLGRYCERADWTMRLMRGALNSIEDAGPAQDIEPAQRALEMLLAKDPQVAQIPAGELTAAAAGRLVAALISSPGRAFGLRNTLEHVHRVSSLIRDRLSVELWQVLEVFRENPVWLGERPPEDAQEFLDLLNRGIITLAAFNGMAAENMTRNHGWRFLDMGRRLERVFNLAELLLTLFGEERGEDEEAGSLLFALEAADSLLTFRTRYLFAPMLAPVLSLLLIDEANPRSIAFQLVSISKHLEALPQASEGGIQTEEQRLTLASLTRVRLAQVLPLASPAGGKREELRALLTGLIAELPKLSEAIACRYFSLTEDTLTRVNNRLG